MNKTSNSGVAVAVAVALCLGGSQSAGAQSSGGSYEIKSAVIAGGGGPIIGGAYQITSTLGQPATSTLSGAGFVVFDGFWAPVDGSLGDRIFANGFENF